MYQVKQYSYSLRGYSDIKYITTDKNVELPESKGYRYRIGEVEHKDKLHINKCPKIYALVEVDTDWHEDRFCSYLSDSVSGVILNGSKYHTGYNDNHTSIWEYDYDANINKYLEKNYITSIYQVDKSYDILYVSDLVVDSYLNQEEESIYNKRIKNKEDELDSTSSKDNESLI